MTLPGDAISRFRRNSRHNILFKHQEAISIDKYELGLVRNYKHRIHLKNENPVYRKQFKIPEAHHNFMEQTLEEWLKLGVVWSSDSGKPGKNKLKAIQTAKAPADVKMIRSFGGLCNFFRTHIKTLRSLLLHCSDSPGRIPDTREVPCQKPPWTLSATSESSSSQSQ